jgi:hypothetical protein
MDGFMETVNEFQRWMLNVNLMMRQLHQVPIIQLPHLWRLEKLSSFVLSTKNMISGWEGRGWVAGIVACSACPSEWNFAVGVVEKFMSFAILELSR